MKEEVSEKDSLCKKKEVECPRKYKQAGFSVYVARVNNGYCKSFPSVRALANITNATVHFRRFVMKSPVSPSVRHFLRRGNKNVVPEFEFLSLNIDPCLFCLSF